MPTWKLNIFIRVVKLRVNNENKTADEIINEYPSLTAEEKDTILANL